MEVNLKVDNAIIMAAGTSSRLAPISYEKPKPLIKVKGEILVERQIRQLKQAGIKEIILIVGYKSELFTYLKKKMGVTIVYNPYYNTHNNISSIYVAKNYIKNTYICSSDNYFINNPFNKYEDNSFYSSLYTDQKTNEWCLYFNDDLTIKNVKKGGTKSWYMIGHSFWSKDFSNRILDILELEFKNENNKDKFWEDIYIENINHLEMKIKKYSKDYIFEFDSLEELRSFDSQYINNSGSLILNNICEKLKCQEKDIINIQPIKEKNESIGFYFTSLNKFYQYLYAQTELKEVDEYK